LNRLTAVPLAVHQAGWQASPDVGYPPNAHLVGPLAPYRAPRSGSRAP